MSNTTDDTKQIILTISQLDGTIDGLSNDSCLGDLNFDNNMCSDLCRQLNNYLQAQGSGNTINSRSISAGMTVRQIIDMVNNLL